MSKPLRWMVHFAIRPVNSGLHLDVYDPVSLGGEPAPFLSYWRVVGVDVELVRDDRFVDPYHVLV